LNLLSLIIKYLNKLNNCLYLTCFKIEY